MNNLLTKYIPGIVFLITMALLVFHTFKADFIVVDNSTILLVVLLLLTPYASSITKLKWGGLEAEIQPSEVRRIEKEVENLPELQKGTEFYEIKNISDEILSILEIDHVLALSKLRIELEKILNKILISKKTNCQSKISIGQTLRIFEKENLINKSYLGPIREVIHLCNRAIHGEDIKEKDADTIIYTGLDLLNKLHAEYYTLITKPIEKKTLTKKAIENYEDAKYKVKTVIPILDKPYMNSYIFTQEQLDQFLEGYEEYAEFLISIKKIDQE